jgi:hypothetical protein
MKIDSRGGWQAVNGPVTAMFKIAPENSQDPFSCFVSPADLGDSDGTAAD